MRQVPWSQSVSQSARACGTLQLSFGQVEMKCRKKGWAEHKSVKTGMFMWHAVHTEETLSTLSYATRAKNIRNRPVVQVGRAARLQFHPMHARFSRTHHTRPLAWPNACCDSCLVACNAHVWRQVDANEAAIYGLRRELQLLRAENAYLRDQVITGGRILCMAAK
jgi:hypothetical protein